MTKEQLILTVIFAIYLVFMQIRAYNRRDDLSRRIDKLKEASLQAIQETQELRDHLLALTFQIENPAKYKVGDTVKGNKIMSCIIGIREGCETSIEILGDHAYCWNYHTYNRKENVSGWLTEDALEGL